MKFSSNHKLLLTLVTATAFLALPVASSSAAKKETKAKTVTTTSAPKPTQSMALTSEPNVAATSTPNNTYNHNYTIADFTSTNNTTVVNGRFWYANIVSMRIADGQLVISSNNQNEWGSFGIDPGCNGERGKPISTTGYSFIVIDMSGQATGLKLELYSQDGRQESIWLNGSSVKEQLPPSVQNSFISKLQFVVAPGNTNLRISKIYLSN